MRFNFLCASGAQRRGRARFARPAVIFVAVLSLAASAGPTHARQEVVDFDDLTLEAESYWRGPDPNGEVTEGQYGVEVVGAFTTRGVEFVNVDEQTYGSWRGFAYSNTTDTTTPGYLNQFSAATGSGAGPGADNYGVAYGYWDLEGNLYQPTPFDAANPEHLFALPTLELPYGRSIQSASITNTTYAALSMQTGDSFAKKFGGESGDDPDWLRLIAYGTDDAGDPLGVAVEFYLADFRFENSSEDYIVSEWTDWDLSALAGARRLHFNVASTDHGIFGLNTPAYFAIDNLVLDVTIQPGDYNGDGFVNAADYTVWRDSEGQTVERRGLSADGDLSGVIDAADHALWSTHYGATPGTATAVPEPATLVALVAPLLSFVFRSGRRVG